MKNSQFKKSIIPNLLTFFRILLVPLFVGVFISSIKFHREISAIIFIISSITDFLDGYIARKYKSETDMGRILDPLADKILVISALILLAIKKDIPIWILEALFLRELILIIGSALIIKREEKIICPSIWGKLATVFIFIGISGILLRIWITRYFLYIGVVISLVSGIDYILKGIKVLRNSDGR